MKKNPFTMDEASDLYDANPASRRGPTPYKLIVNGIVTYAEWLEAMKFRCDNDVDDLLQDDHGLYLTTFGKKINRFFRSIGFYGGFFFARKYHYRSTDYELEAVKLLNMRISLYYK